MTNTADNDIIYTSDIKLFEGVLTYEFSGVLSGTYILSVDSLSGRLKADSVIVTVDKSDITKDIAVQVCGFAVTGDIVSYGNSTDTVTVRLISGSDEIDYLETTDGSYAFENVSNGVYTVEVSKKNHVTRSYEITVADADVVNDVKICLIGDATGDGKVNTIDVNRVYAHVKGTNLLTGYALSCANVIGTGDTVNTIDVNRIYAHVKGTNLLW